MNQLEEVKRGEEAQRLMDHPLLKEALGNIHSGLLDAMKNSAMGDEKTHNKLVMAFQILSKIEGHLLETMQTGKLAVIQLEKENTITKLKRAASKFTS
jgi:hypothetical protein